jgi:preprotein translocase subunit SecA
MRNRVIERCIQAFTADQNQDEWNIKGMTEELKRLCIPAETMASEFKNMSRKEMVNKAKELADEKYQLRAEPFKSVNLDIKDLERLALLHSVDIHWMDHIDQMDQLRQGISLRSMAQRDPLQEYTIEGFDMFEEMNRLIQEDAVRFAYNAAFNIQVASPKATKEGAGGDKAPQRPKKAGEVQVQKIGRNDPCPCGSGKKYKACCGK